MTRWANVEQAIPEIAGPTRERIERYGFVLAGTIRRDGTPRISPVEAHFVEPHLMLVMLPGSLKARDLHRDPRIVLNTPVTDPRDPVMECKLRGRAVAAKDVELRERTADTIAAASGWRPRDDWHFFSLEVDELALILWEEGAMEMTLWRREVGLRRTRRPAPLLGDGS